MNSQQDRSAAGRVKILLNGEPREAPDHATVHDVLDDLNLAGGPLAVEVNCLIVPRERHGAHVLKEGDQVEVVRLVGGG